MECFEHLRERFWSNVRMEGDCWLWTGSLTKKGRRGRLGTHRHGDFPAHLVACELHGVTLAKGVRHDRSCGHTHCVNPEHIVPFVGTAKARAKAKREAISKARAMLMIGPNAPGNRKPIPIEETYWPKVDKRGYDECWPWKGSTVPGGYGVVRGRLAHRIGVELAGRPIPQGMVARHSCHNPGCVNPAHIIKGTQKDNARDMMDAGRWATGPSTPPNVVREVRRRCASGESLNDVAAQFGLHRNTVKRIKARRVWKDIA